MAQKIATFIAKNGDTIFPSIVTASIVDGNQLAKSSDVYEVKSDINDFKNINTPWSDWSKEGMALLNGAQQYSEDGDYPRYRTRVINGNKQVQVKFRIKGVTSGGNAAYVSFPSNIKPTGISQLGFSSPSSNGRTASWLIEGENTVKLHAASDNIYNSQFWYPFVGTWEV